jgi:hypothetical protein
MVDTPNFKGYVDSYDNSVNKFISQQSEERARSAQPEESRTIMEVPQQRQMVENPFNSPQYNSIRVPDTPIMPGGGIADSLLNNNEIPDAIIEKYWWVVHKDNTLTFLDDERKRSKLLNFDIAKIDILNTLPYYDYTFEKELELGIMRNVFETKLDRALGFKGTGQKNERTILQSSFSEQKIISESGGTPSTVREGFFKRLMGRR